MRAQLCAQIHRAHRLLQRVKPHARIVGCKGTILEYRIIEEIRRRHWHLHTVIVESLFEFAHDAITLLRRRIDPHEVIVMKIDPISAEPAQLFDHFDGTQTRPRGIAKRIASAIAHGPEPESEFVFRVWLVIVTRHLFSPVARNARLRIEN